MADKRSSGKWSRALSDVMDRIPNERFGTGDAKRLRKSVLVAIAMSADPDGSNSYPGEKTIAHRCLVTEKAVRNVIRWWEAQGFLRVECKASPRGTNRYTIDLDGLLDPERKVPGDPERSVPHGTRNETPSDPERNEVAPGTKQGRPGTLRSANRPLDRPYKPRETGNAARSLHATGGGQAAQHPVSEQTAGDLADFCAQLYQIATEAGESGKAFSGQERRLLAELVSRFSAAEVKAAYSEHVSGLDAFDLKGANKRFVDGAGEAIILTARRRKEHVAKTQEQIQEISKKLRAESEAEMAELNAARAEEEALIERELT